MDVEIAIRYSDDRPCTATAAEPGGGLCRIVMPCAGILQSVAERLRKARWLFAAEPRAGNKPH